MRDKRSYRKNLTSFILVTCYKEYGILSLPQLLSEMQDAYPDHQYIYRVTLQALKSLFRQGLIDFSFLYNDVQGERRATSRSLMAELQELVDDPEKFKKYRRQAVSTAILAFHAQINTMNELKELRRLRNRVLKSRLTSKDAFRSAKEEEVERLKNTGLPQKYSKIKMITLTDEGIAAARKIIPIKETESCQTASTCAIHKSF